MLKIEVRNGHQNPVLSLAVEAEALGVAGVAKAIVDLLATVGVGELVGVQTTDREAGPNEWIKSLTAGQQAVLRAMADKRLATPEDLRRRLSVGKKSLGGLLGNLAKKLREGRILSPYHLEQDENGDPRYVWTGWAL